MVTRANYGDTCQHEGRGGSCAGAALRTILAQIIGERERFVAPLARRDRTSRDARGSICCPRGHVPHGTAIRSPPCPSCRRAPRSPTAGSTTGLQPPTEQPQPCAVNSQRQTPRPKGSGFREAHYNSRTPAPAFDRFWFFAWFIWCSYVGESNSCPT